MSAPGVEGALAIRNMRRHLKINREQAAAALGISVPTLSYYESGTNEVPKTVLLAVLALENGLQVMPLPLRSRERWVTLVENMRDFWRGEPIVGRMLRARDIIGLYDFLEFVRKGPDPDLAMTDPALFRWLSDAVMRAHLAGLRRYEVRPEHVEAATAKLADAQRHDRVPHPEPSRSP